MDKNAQASLLTPGTPYAGPSGSGPLEPFLSSSIWSSKGSRLNDTILFFLFIFGPSGLPPFLALCAPFCARAGGGYPLDPSPLTIPYFPFPARHLPFVVALFVAGGYQPPILSGPFIGPLN